MDTKIIRDIIAKREATSDEWQYGVEQCWEELSSALADDYRAARKFLLEDCTADEASWISEVYEEIIQKTQSGRYIDLLRRSIGRFPEEDRLHHMSRHLDTAIADYYIG